MDNFFREFKESLENRTGLWIGIGIVMIISIIAMSVGISELVKYIKSKEGSFSSNPISDMNPNFRTVQALSDAAIAANYKNYSQDGFDAGSYSPAYYKGRSVAGAAGIIDNTLVQMAINQSQGIQTD